ncbi:hypothetical protein [Breoghania sp.]|uniref:hypothetical protein n=1 Tax=Breoghania sp. TaxID=2065378 RepID=UPI002602716C|nr:hypothetical protein [Breoghania sp.]MDJ0931282.1 hypothetical protein [Breoghania sp.]
MALRLNTLLAELKFRRPCASMTKDKLKRLFQAELDRMNTMMDDIVTVAQVTGTHTDPR